MAKEHRAAPTDKHAVDEYIHLKHKAHARLEQVQRERRAQLLPKEVFLPRRWQPLFLDTPITLFKVVAAAGGRFVSTFDGSVEYVPLKWVHARQGGCCSKELWPPLWSCMFCFATPKQALAARFPEGSKHLHGARVLLRVEAKGHAYVAGGGCWAVSSLLVQEVVRYDPMTPADKFLEYK